MVIVDTDVLIDVFRRYAPAVEWMAKTVAENEIVLPGFVLMELIQGARNKEEQETMRKTIEEYAVVWPSLASDVGLPLHTCNKKHYENVPGLDVIEPYQKNTH
jgi:hypothetical protein